MFVFISQFPVFLIGKFAGISREKTPKLNVMVKKWEKLALSRVLLWNSITPSVDCLTI